MKSPGAISTILVIAIGALALCAKADGFFSGLFFAPFALGPLFVSLVLAFVLRKKKSQIALLIGSALYAFWFSFAYVDVFYRHLDPQSPISMLFVGVYALPVMALVWLIASFLGRTTSQEI